MQGKPFIILPVDVTDAFLVGGQVECRAGTLVKKSYPDVATAKIHYAFLFPMGQIGIKHGRKEHG